MQIPVIISAITCTAIVVSVVFAWVQIQAIKKQRERESELLLARSFQTPEFMKAMGLVMHLPDGLSKKELEEKVGDKIDLVLLWLGTWESLGILVFRYEISIERMDDFFSGPVIISWRKLQGYVKDDRKELNRDTMHEWFQWLAERMMERESKNPALPANEAHKGWKSKG
jgi:hypothetical protein